MKNNELQEIWKTMDTETHQKSKEELNLLLKSKTRQSINKFLVIIAISSVICIGLIIFLIITSIHRENDLLYIINNITLGILAIISLIAGLLSWYKLQNNSYDQPLKTWLEERIIILSKCLTGRYNKLYIILIPFLYVLTVISIHVYFENTSFIEVFKSEESIIGLIIAAPIGLFVAYFAAKKIREFQLHNLEFLKDLYHRLCNIS